MFRTLAARLIARTASRPPDVIIGGALHPYLRRWWLIPRNRWLHWREFTAPQDAGAIGRGCGDA